MFVLPSSYHSFWTVVLEKTLESPLDCKEIKPVNPKGNQSWIFIGRTDAEAPILWPPDAKNWLTGKDHRLKAGGEGDDRRWDGWMASLTRWTWVWVGSGGCDGQGNLACCRPWGWTRLSNWTDYHPKKNVSFLKVSNSSLKTNIVGICCSFIHPKWSQCYLSAPHLPSIPWVVCTCA